LGDPESKRKGTIFRSLLAMRFHSTIESVQKNQITVLAIIECFVAIAIYVCVGLHFKSFRSLAVAATLAPLTLIRTEESVLWGLRKGESLGDWVETTLKHYGLPVFLTFIIGVTFVFAARGAIRVISMAYMAVRLPLRTLREMPNNWLRQA